MGLPEPLGQHSSGGCYWGVEVRTARVSDAFTLSIVLSGVEQNAYKWSGKFIELKTI